MGLVSGILLIVLAFWTSGQFFLERAYTLLIFAGIWALLKGVTDTRAGLSAQRPRLGLNDPHAPCPLGRARKSPA